MESIKKYGIGLIGLLVALIALMFILNQAKKLPVIGKTWLPTVICNTQTNRL